MCGGAGDREGRPYGFLPMVRRIYGGPSRTPAPTDDYRTYCDQRENHPKNRNSIGYGHKTLTPVSDLEEPYAAYPLFKM